MISIRIIPILLLKDEGLVKTVCFKNPNYIGDPINAVRIFNEKEVDEIVLLDITASKENREPKYEWIKDIVSESFMPLAYGGGIKNFEQIKKLFDIGIEKIIINSSIFNFELITQAANIFGNQSIVASIDVKKNLWGNYQIFTQSGSIKHNTTLESLTKKIVDAGVGEIIIQSISHEGTMKGFDLELIKEVASLVNVPVVASGGAGSLKDFKEAIEIGGASAVAAGSLFIYKGIHKAVLINYPDSVKLKNTFIND